MAPRSASPNRIQLEHELSKMTKLAAETSKQHDFVSKLEAKTFKVVDKLEMSGKNETQKFYEAKAAWLAASHQSDVKYVALQNVLGRCRTLVAQIAESPEPQKINPFLKKAAKSNPMIARLLAQGKIS